MTWKLTLPCTRDEAESLDVEIAGLAALEPPPVLMTSEPDPQRPHDWRLDAYFETEPARETLEMLRGLVPSAGEMDLELTRLEEQDWVTLSQAGLEPIRAGRFFVHTPAHRGEIPIETIALEIDAGRAFGTGHHETTTGCLMALDRLKATGARFGNILDLGTGTGLLAFAALRLWPLARVAASDIDLVSIQVTEENAAVNGIGLGRGPGRVEALTAPGLEHQRLKARAPYDLIIANILAGPLIELAPSVGKALAPGGRLILAGLLAEQADAVASAYRRQGLMAAFRVERGDWPTIVMRKRRSLDRR